MKQILVLDDLGIEHATLSNLLAQKQLYYYLCPSQGEITNNESVEGIITVTSKVNKHLLEQFPNLKFVAVAFTGYDCVDLESCRERSIPVFNVPSYSTDSVAELVIGLAISLLREIPKGFEEVKNGGWKLSDPGIELRGKKIGIIGTGNIGCRLAELFTVFGCEVYGWSRSQRTEFIEKGGKYVNNLQELCSMVDILSLHIPLNEHTKGLIGEKELDTMKDTAFLINAARGPVVNTKSLAKALLEKQIAGAAVDVFDVEPIERDNPLIRLDNIILSPHIAFKTKEALLRRAEITLGNISSYLHGKSINRIDC